MLCAIAAHTVTYALVGMLAFSVLDYPSLFAERGLRDLMLPATDERLVLGPAFQVIRGALYGVLVHRLRAPILETDGGWRVLWLVLVVVGIFGTFGPAPGSLEGVFFTTVPLVAHLRGLPEVLTQSLALSVLLTHWLAHPERRWMSWAIATMFAAACVVPVLGHLSASALP